MLCEVVEIHIEAFPMKEKSLSAVPRKVVEELPLDQRQLLRAEIPRDDDPCAAMLREP